MFLHLSALPSRKLPFKSTISSAIANVEQRLHVVGSCAMQFMIIFNPVRARRVYVVRAHTLGRGVVGAASR